MATKIPLSESLEDYLEVILQLQETNNVARTKEIAGEMGVSLASVTASLKKLSEKELINYTPYKAITLTNKGQSVAREVLRKHHIIRDFLTRILAIDPVKADATACRIEHAMDKASVKKLFDFVSFLDTCPRVGKNWLQEVRECSSCKPDKQQCGTCLDECNKKHQE